MPAMDARLLGRLGGLRLPRSHSPARGHTAATEVTRETRRRSQRGAVTGAALLLFLTFLLLPSLSATAAESGTRYAESFDLETLGEATLLTIRGGSAGDELHYLLVPRDGAEPEEIRERHGSSDIPENATVVRTPVRTVVTLSSTYLPAFLELGVDDRIVGHDRRSWVYAEDIRRRMEAGDIAEVGETENLDMELMLSLDPEVVLANTEGEQGSDPRRRLERNGLTVVSTAEHREHTPLGRSEWVLAIGALFERTEEARELFAEIEERYLRLQERVEQVTDRPTVFLNAPWGSSWAMPEGENYSAVFLEDAGAEYVFSDRGDTGTLFLDVETVLDEAAEAEYWLNPGQYESLAELKAEDSRFSLFEAFREERVYNNDARTASGGGNDYFESGYLHADRVLADLITVFHPELMDDHELFYYRRLR